MTEKPFCLPHASILGTLHNAPWRYEPETKTLRDSRNHWLASFDSWDGAPDHEVNAETCALVPEMVATLKWYFDNAQSLGHEGTVVPIRAKAAEILQKVGSLE